MGPSGCGKTTLLNLLVDRVGSKGVQGTITMNGHKPTKNAKRFVAYCTQDDVFFPQLTVKETLGFTVSNNDLLRYRNGSVLSFALVFLCTLIKFLFIHKCNRLDYVFRAPFHDAINKNRLIALW